MASLFRGQSMSIILALATAAILVILLRPQSVNRDPYSSSTEKISNGQSSNAKSDSVSPAKSTLTFSNDELLYFDTGIGDKAKYEARLPKYIRTRIADPVSFKPSSEWTRKDYSQFGQTAIINKLLNNRTNGFFVECGAHDGIVDSNTVFQELERNWTGLLMEGDPQVYPKLLRSGRRAYMLPHCISPVDKPFRANFRIAGGFQGLSDFFRLHREPDKNTLRETLVTCFPFNAIMDALGVKHVDFFSLDVEGAELEVLQTIDFKRIRIDLFIIEYSYSPQEQKVKESNERLEKYRALFNATGLYKEVGIINLGGTNLGLDVIFKRIDVP